jgi:hypothetical protein
LNDDGGGVVRQQKALALQVTQSTKMPSWRSTPKSRGLCVAAKREQFVDHGFDFSALQLNPLQPPRRYIGSHLYARGSAKEKPLL